MPADLRELCKIHPKIQNALLAQMPVVALETTVITHGLPFPQNLLLARDLETEVSRQGSLPATIGVLNGVIKIRFEADELGVLVHQNNLHKLSSRDLDAALAFGWSEGTTVAGSILAA